MQASGWEAGDGYLTNPSFVPRVLQPQKRPRYIEIKNKIRWVCVQYVSFYCRPCTDNDYASTTHGDRMIKEQRQKRAQLLTELEDAKRDHDQAKKVVAGLLT